LVAVPIAFIQGRDGKVDENWLKKNAQGGAALGSRLGTATQKRKIE
jgi:hypothetical protein